MMYKSEIPVLGAVVHKPKRQADSYSAPAAATDQRGGAATLIYIFLVLLALPTVTGAWYTVGSTNENLAGASRGSVLLQYSLWAMLPLLILTHVKAHGLKYYKKSVGLFMPLFFVGFISAFQGVFPIISLKVIVLWLACASVSVVAAGGLSQRRAIQLVFYAIFIELILSVILALLFKRAGLDTDPREGGAAWRGVFAGRPFLGLVSGWGLLLALFRKEVGWTAAVGMIGCAGLCLYKAHAAGPLLASACSICFLMAVVLLRRAPLPTLAKTLILLIGSVIALTAVLFIMPLIFQALHRDVTLTGRTEIWQAYLPKALSHPFLGQGPGSFSILSPITVELFFRFIKLGAIRTPHNMYIIALGECGIPGLLAFAGALFYIAFVLPFRTLNSTTLVLSAGVMLVMVNGFAEIDMVFSRSASLFIIILLLCIRGDSPKTI